jgi:hypothetical protein
MQSALTPNTSTAPAHRSTTLARWAVAVGVLLIPVVFVTYFFLRDGMVYTYTEGDAWEGYSPGLRLLTHNPVRTYFLTEDPFQWPPREENGPPYTHNSWMVPRLVSVFWYLVGFENVLWNIYVSSLFVYAICAACAVFFLRAHFWAALLALAFLHLDFFGYLRFIADAPLAWYPALTSMVVISAFAPSRIGYGLGFLALFLAGQHMIPYAIFLAAVAAGLPLLMLAATGTAPANIKWRWFWAAAGFGISLGIFVAQLLLYYGPDGLVLDLVATLEKRNMGGVEAAPQAFSQLLEMYSAQRRLHIVPADLFQFIRHSMAAVVVQYHWLQVVAIVFGLVWLPALLIRRLTARGRSVPMPMARRDTVALGVVAWTMVLGYLACAIILRGQTYMLHLLHFGPMLVFGLAAAFALTTLVACRGLFNIIQCGTLPVAAQPAAVGLALILLGTGVLGSLRNAETWSIMPGGVFWEISKSEYQVQRMMIGQGGPVFALAWLISGVHPYRSDAPATQRTNATWGMPSYYICVEHWHMGNHYGDTCHESAYRIAAMGHEPPRLEPGWAIVKLNPRGRFPRTR